MDFRSLDRVPHARTHARGARRAVPPRGPLAAAVVGAAALVFTASAPTVAQQRVPAAVVARNLAENILGEGTVRSVQVGAGGRQIVITWDSVLYRPAHTRAKNREQLRGEAELATGAIMGVLRPELISFRILLKERAIARGTRSPGGFTITYARDLDG
jgi:hypothetical protein